jgi:hypothetical protein
VKIINIARLKWLERIERIEDTVPCRKTTFTQPEGSRKKERLRLRWLNLILKDLKTMEVNA